MRVDEYSAAIAKGQVFGLSSLFRLSPVTFHVFTFQLCPHSASPPDNQRGIIAMLQIATFLGVQHATWFRNPCFRRDFRSPPMLHLSMCCGVNG
jgi:hypothetical protein